MVGSYLFFVSAFCMSKDIQTSHSLYLFCLLQFFFVLIIEFAWCIFFLDGICHVYIDKSANMEMVKRVVLDAKIDYPAACNAVVTHCHLFLVLSNLLYTSDGYFGIYDMNHMIDLLIGDTSRT